MSEPVCVSAKTLAKTEEFDETDWGVRTRTLGNSDGLGGPGRLRERDHRCSAAWAWGLSSVACYSCNCDGQTVSFGPNHNQ